jgi:MFS family permease
VLPLALGSTLNPINSTMISTAIVPIAREFDATAAQTGWLIAGLYLTSAIAQPTMGRLADLFGARRVYLISLLLVALAGLAGEFAPTLGALVAVRILLGIGTSGAYPSAMRIFRSEADRVGSPPPRTPMGVLSLAGIATTALGPVMGGLLTGAFGWHSIFTVNMPLALVTAVFVLIGVPRDAPRSTNWEVLAKEIDVGGIALFGAALLGLMFLLMNINHPKWWLLPVSGVFWLALVCHSLKRPQPFIDVRMLAHNIPLTVTFLRIATILLVPYCMIYGFAQWLESAAHYSASTAGLVTLPMSAMAGICSLLAARTKDLRIPFIVAAAGGVIGCVSLLFVHSTTPIWLIGLAVMFIGIPMGSSSTGTQAAIFLQAPASNIGTAAGLQRTFTYMGAIGAASLLGIVYGHHATDPGFHSLAIVMTCVTILLLIFTIFDRTLPRATAS